MHRGNGWKSFPTRFDDIFDFVLAELDKRREAFPYGSNQWGAVTQCGAVCARDARMKLICGAEATLRIDAPYIEAVKTEFVEQLEDCLLILGKGSLRDIREAYPPFRDNAALWRWFGGEATEHPLRRLHRLRFHPDAPEPVAE